MATAASYFTIGHAGIKGGDPVPADESAAIPDFVDAIIDGLAERHALARSADCREGPTRSLVWGNGVCRSIQISLECKDRLILHLRLCTSQDRGSRCFGKETSMRVALSPDEMEADLPGLLAMAYQRANSWQEPALTSATEDLGDQIKLPIGGARHRNAQVRRLGNF